MTSPRSPGDGAPTTGSTPTSATSDLSLGDCDPMKGHDFILSDAEFESPDSDLPGSPEVPPGTLDNEPAKANTPSTGPCVSDVPDANASAGKDGSDASMADVPEAQGSGSDPATSHPIKSEPDDLQAPESLPTGETAAGVEAPSTESVADGSGFLNETLPAGTEMTETELPLGQLFYDSPFEVARLSSPAPEGTTGPPDITRALLVVNNGSPQSMRLLIAARSLFRKQLPNMPPEYVTRLVLDWRHRTLVLIRDPRPPEEETTLANGRYPRDILLGAITYRPFDVARIGEIVFCAVHSDQQQVRGHGARLMSALASHARRHTPLRYWLTYADNHAVGYFRKQGFTTNITLPRTKIGRAHVYADNHAVGYFRKQGFTTNITLPRFRWAGRIKDYDGGTLMQCALLPLGATAPGGVLGSLAAPVRPDLPLEHLNADLLDGATAADPFGLGVSLSGPGASPTAVTGPAAIAAASKEESQNDYAHWRSVVQRQKKYVHAAIRMMGQSHMVHAGLEFARLGSGMCEEVPGYSGVPARVGALPAGHPSPGDDPTEAAASITASAAAEPGSDGAGAAPLAGLSPAVLDALVAEHRARPLRDPAATFPVRRVSIASIPGIAEAGWESTDLPARRPGPDPWADRRGAGPRSPLRAVLRRLLRLIQSKSFSWPFRQPVNVEDVTDYLDVIKEPMDLRTMEEKLNSENPVHYQSIDAFHRDLSLIFENCWKYNLESTTYYKCATELHDFAKVAIQEAARDLDRLTRSLGLQPGGPRSMQALAGSGRPPSRVHPTADFLPPAGGGDLGDGLSPSDPRFSIQVDSSPVDRHSFEDDFSPLPGAINKRRHLSLGADGDRSGHGGGAPAAHHHHHHHHSHHHHSPSSGKSRDPRKGRSKRGVRGPGPGGPAGGMLHPDEGFSDTDTYYSDDPIDVSESSGGGGGRGAAFAGAGGRSRRPRKRLLDESDEDFSDSPSSAPRSDDSFSDVGHRHRRIRRAVDAEYATDEESTSGHYSSRHSASGHDGHRYHSASQTSHGGHHSDREHTGRGRPSRPHSPP
ncbi:hypothetical protein H696_05197 [Fonticula alba]|uniref:Histone acetyltransferase n=1 Tax=Fonticula alba TaxID=691883 RepID=A0A058Z2B2_FONAL|nr:hypothetical protein H696_05197 [Fonticula alba]KCV68276.1 hypothetical protein H696_05197 [Fonticula alba]|eukprot:XP_009497330.1 hypothetical protein H696_05197 [Fonticula alba]